MLFRSLSSASRRLETGRSRDFTPGLQVSSFRPAFRNPFITSYSLSFLSKAARVTTWPSSLSGPRRDRPLARSTRWVSRLRESGLPCSISSVSKGRRLELGRERADGQCMPCLFPKLPRFLGFLVQSVVMRKPTVRIEVTEELAGACRQTAIGFVVK